MLCFGWFAHHGPRFPALRVPKWLPVEDSNPDALSCVAFRLPAFSLRPQFTVVGLSCHTAARSVPEPDFRVAFQRAHSGIKVTVAGATVVGLAFFAECLSGGFRAAARCLWELLHRFSNGFVSCRLWTRWPRPSRRDPVLGATRFAVAGAPFGYFIGFPMVGVYPSGKLSGGAFTPPVGRALCATVV